MKTRAPAPRRRQSGFALLITITLLAFLVLLLVSLAALTRVETQVASNSQQLSQARQNALMALNIALGRLQATAGPDTRITGTADLVSGRDITKKNWTGVWNAATAGTDKNIAWLVSGTAAAGSGGVATPLPGKGTVELVGANSTDISATATTGNQVKVETQPITSDTVAGVPGTQIIGNFAYWVGDEGVKAKVSVTDPWLSPLDTTLKATTPQTTTAQAQSYSFINAQRFGIEAIEDSAGTPLNAAYPATSTDSQTRDDFKATLPKILALAQLPLANPAGQTALTSAQKVRFHDLTASSGSLLVDVVKGGFKKDLTAWTSAGNTTSNPVSSNASDDYITLGDPADTSKYGLPTWAMIRDYTNTRNTGAAITPRKQTPSQQGVYPVMTYARIGYNVTCASTGGIYKINIMPVVALWNPYNIPIAASTFEFCFKYHSTSSTSGYGPGNFLKLIIYAGSPNPGTEAFNLSTIRMASTSYGTGNAEQFWRFKMELSKDLAPGESRLFTIADSHDDTQYAIGQSTLTDAALAPNNAVYVPSKIALNQKQMSGLIFWNTEFNGGMARMTFLLTKPIPASVIDPATIQSLLRSEAYQAILGNALDWNQDTNPNFTIPPSNNGIALVYQRIELAMSTLPTTYPEEIWNTNGGTPRWLAELNPQASVVLRKPFASGLNVTPSYLNEPYIRNTVTANPKFVYKQIPSAVGPNGTNVSAGTRVSTTGAAQNLVLREFQPAGIPLFSIAQLQHVNVSSLSINPAYAIGNSVANIYIKRDDPDAQSEALTNDGDTDFPNGTFTRIYDLSYLLNRALWDGYFFSTIPSTLTTAQANNTNYHLPNARYQFYPADGTLTNSQLNDLKTPNAAAAHLLVNGGYNINSTSVQAWRALLYSHNGIPPSDPAAPPDALFHHPYSRFTTPTAGTMPNATWLGYRILSDAQISALATAIAVEVRNRGPFLSLADFVNRRLASNETGLKGPLQAAIDATSGSGSINNDALFTDSSTRVNSYPPVINGDAEQQTIYMGGTDATQPSASRAAFAPGYLTQADLLTALGPSLTARSDTFRIRAYGDVVNPAVGGATPDAHAWCEAIVQRLPDYMDNSMPAETDLSAAPTSPAKTTNQAFGRRFKVISFRWLSSNDI